MYLPSHTTHCSTVAVCLIKVDGHLVYMPIHEVKGTARSLTLILRTETARIGTYSTTNTVLTNFSYDRSHHESASEPRARTLNLIRQQCVKTRMSCLITITNSDSTNKKVEALTDVYASMCVRTRSKVCERRVVLSRTGSCESAIALAVENCSVRVMNLK